MSSLAYRELDITLQNRNEGRLVLAPERLPYITKGWVAEKGSRQR